MSCVEREFKVTLEQISPNITFSRNHLVGNTSRQRLCSYEDNPIRPHSAFQNRRFFSK